MKKIGLLLLLPLVLLPSCGTNSVDFSFTDDYRLPYLTRNGDLVSSSDPSLSYNELTRVSTASEISKLIQSHEQFLLLFYGDSCGHCASIHSRFGEFIQKSKVNCYSIRDDGKGSARTEINALIGEYPSFASTFKFVTPSLYFVSSATKAEDLSIMDHIDNTSAFQQYMKGKANYTSIYKFRTAQALSDFTKENDALVYFLSESEESTSFYQAELLENRLARHKEKNLAVVELSYLSEGSKSALLEEYGSNYSSKIFHKEKGSILASSLLAEESTSSLLDSYYSA